MNSDELRKLQLVELEILSVVAEFCDDNNIKYSLTAGTALGAVRHGGFIPWDDDVDICMERTEYNRFISLWKKKGIPGFFLQSTNDRATTINHSKVRKDKTVLASKSEYKHSGHHGIWVDIFPFDKIPNNKIIQNYIYFISVFRLVYTRNYPFKAKGKGLEWISKVLLFLPENFKKIIKKKCDKEVMKYRNIKSGYCLMSLSAPVSLRRYYPEKMMQEFTTIAFENRSFKITSLYHEMLQVSYGDYMQLPPESQRVCKHNPEVLIFDN